MHMRVLLISFILAFDLSYSSAQSGPDDSQWIHLRPVKAHCIYVDTLTHPRAPQHLLNTSLGFTVFSNYYKNVPVEERSPNDNVFSRSYIQTTSGAIYYYDEIYRMGRRH